MCIVLKHLSEYSLPFGDVGGRLFGRVEARLWGIIRKCMHILGLGEKVDIQRACNSLVASVGQT